MLFRNDSAPVAICLFRLSEDTFAETRSALQHFAYTGNFDNVYPNGNNHK